MMQASTTPVTLKVSSTSSPGSVAGAIANSIRERGKCDIQAIGPGAINQAVKAIAIARRYVVPGGVDLVLCPTFVDLAVDGETRTAIRFAVEARAV